MSKAPDKALEALAAIEFLAEQYVPSFVSCRRGMRCHPHDEENHTCRRRFIVLPRSRIRRASLRTTLTHHRSCSLLGVEAYDYKDKRLEIRSSPA